jgi:hypothetical protein
MYSRVAFRMNGEGKRQKEVKEIKVRIGKGTEEKIISRSPMFLDVMSCGLVDRHSDTHSNMPMQCITSGDALRGAESSCY